MSLGQIYKRTKGVILSPLAHWWEGQRDRHLVMLGTLSVLGFSLVMWSVVFFFFLDGAMDPELADLVQLTWIGLMVGITLLIFAAPEFFHYHAKWSVLMAILESTSRADLGRQRKEAEEAAALLGTVWSARLSVHFIEHGVIRARDMPEDADRGVPEDFFIQWWGTEDSRLSRWVSIEGLRSPRINRSLGLLGLVTAVLEFCNMAFGLVRNENEDRVNTLNIWDWLNGVGIDSTPAPYFDDLSGWAVMIIASLLFWATFPASGERDTPEDEEE